MHTNTVRTIVNSAPVVRPPDVFRTVQIRARRQRFWPIGPPHGFFRDMDKRSIRA